MAKLEDLIKQTPDARLREEIAREAAALKSTKKFGLVFEEHIPEQVQLPGLPIRVGSRVVKRGNDKKRVKQLKIRIQAAEALEASLYERLDVSHVRYEGHEMPVVAAIESDIHASKLNKTALRPRKKVENI
jgi:hypothetical protein